MLAGISSTTRSILSLSIFFCVAAQFAVAGEVASDTCVLEFKLPVGATVSVDGRDYGQKRTLTYRGLTAGKSYVSQVTVTFTSGQIVKRSVSVVGGQRRQISLEDPNAKNNVRTPSDLFVIAVGISQYSEEIMNLKYAAKDARTLAALFEQRGPQLYGNRRVHVTQLLDEQATKERILESLKSTAAKAKASDTFLLFVAGHGMMLGQRYYLLPHDFTMDGNDFEKDVRQFGIPGDELHEAVQVVAAQRRIVIYDTCQSGGAIPLARWSQPRKTSPKSESGTFIISATSDTADAQEIEQLGHGVLTYCLLAGLGDVANGPLSGNFPGETGGNVRIRDWLNFARHQVPLVTKELLGHEQFMSYHGQGSNFHVLPGPQE